LVAHIALIGDSIFDNAAYTRGLPDVVGHVRRLTPGNMATLIAEDGSTTTDVFEKQLPLLTPDLTHAAVSMGGNDGILHSDLLDSPVASTAEALRAFAQRIALFETSYRRTLDAIVQRVPHVAVCTIYTPNLPGPEAATVRVGLMMLNDVILRTAIEWGLAAVDLRLVVVEPADFANELEPSSQGAAKIARSVVSALRLTADDEGRSRVFAATA
jgi:hypothetical protein